MGLVAASWRRPRLTGSTALTANGPSEQLSMVKIYPSSALPYFACETRILSRREASAIMPPIKGECGERGLSRPRQRRGAQKSYSSRTPGCRRNNCNGAVQSTSLATAYHGLGRPGGRALSKCRSVNARRGDGRIRCSGRV